MFLVAPIPGINDILNDMRHFHTETNHTYCKISTYCKTSNIFLTLAKTNESFKQILLATVRNRFEVDKIVEALENGQEIKFVEEIDEMTGENVIRVYTEENVIEVKTTGGGGDDEKLKKLI